MRLNYLFMMTIAAIQVHTPPHWILGYRWTEMAAIVTIIIAVAGAVSWIVKVTIVNPTNLANQALKQSIDQLSSKVDGIGSNADRVHEEHDRRLDNHETRITVNEQEINDLKEKMK